MRTYTIVVEIEEGLIKLIKDEKNKEAVSEILYNEVLHRIEQYEKNFTKLEGLIK